MDLESDGSGDEFGFASLDLAGVDFDKDADDSSGEDRVAIRLEMMILEGEADLEDLKESNPQECASMPRLLQLSEYIVAGRYIDALTGDSAKKWLLGDHPNNARTEASFWERIQLRLSCLTNVAECVEAEFLAVASFNLFLQLNYTGPTLEDDILQEVNPHPCFREILQSDSEEHVEQQATLTSKRSTKYHNAILSLLAVDGQWPCQVSEVPYFLLLARCIFSQLDSPTSTGWTKLDTSINVSTGFQKSTSSLKGVKLWSLRAAVAHERLLLTSEPTVTLWNEVQKGFSDCRAVFKEGNSNLLPIVLLENGLACYHFDEAKEAKQLFHKAREASGLFVEMTGAMGKRTKFQSSAKAQMVVRASSVNQTAGPVEPKESVAAEVKSQMIELDEENILFERVKFDEDKENEIDQLTVLDQSILLALCLDIKNNNPADGLTAEEMGAYLSRVLCHHDDWIVFSTGLLERAWLEFERTHTKERALLQMQALSDQHTNRLTITQSTQESIEQNSPVQERLKHLHMIVFPPRWGMLQDVAERYASLGILTSAAEVYTEIECWDEVVECYKRAGKDKLAEEIIRERLGVTETPRMWCALGDITQDPECYEKSASLSNGRFCQAYVNLGQFYFDKGDSKKASENYKLALKVRPLLAMVWFRVGTIAMQLDDWEGALSAFSEVVQQQPDEGEAWANIGAVHMHNKCPSEAYPALCESLKQNRNNWRVWSSKLYTCLDLAKYDEAMQACVALMDMKSSHSVQEVPDLEEKCVRAIVGGIVDLYKKQRKEDNKSALESTRRSLGRLQQLLQRVQSSYSDPWVFEVNAYFNESVGNDQQVYENLMSEYRSLTSIRAWEKEDQEVRKVCLLLSQIVQYQRTTKEELGKSKFLLGGVLKRIQKARVDMASTPTEVSDLEKLFDEVVQLYTVSK